MILFHVVAAGACWGRWRAASGTGRAGEVIVLPYGDQHSMGGADEVERVSLATILAPPPWSEFPIIRHGQGGTRTDVVCGYLSSDDPLFDPALRALPPVFVVQPPEARPRSGCGRASTTRSRAAAPPDHPDADTASPRCCSSRC